VKKAAPKHEFINRIIKYYKYDSYLEIGVQRRSNTHDHIQTSLKVAVDPDPNAEADHIMGSDEYFESYNKGRQFDLIFVDGLHHADQVIKDIKNSLMILNEGGSIVVDDCMPHNELMQKIPRDETPKKGNGPGRLWTGDVWKAIAWLRAERSDLSFLGVKLHCGVGLLRRERSELLSFDKALDALTFKDYKNHEKELLNLIDYEEFLNRFPTADF